MVASAFTVGVIVTVGIVLAVQWHKARRKPNFVLLDLPVGLLGDEGRAPSAPFPEDSPHVAPSSPEPAPAWPGKVDQYQIVRYRDDTFRVIEGRIAFKDLADIKPAIRAERAAGYSGKLMRIIGLRMIEVAKWT